VALGVGPYFAAHIVPQAVLRFRERFPDVQLRLVEGLRHATGPMVRDGTLDISVAKADTPRTQCQITPTRRWRGVTLRHEGLEERRHT